MADVPRLSAGRGDGYAAMDAIESQRLGGRLTDGQKAVIDEYAYIKEQLAGPQFAPPAPQITRIEASDRALRIFGKHLRGVRAINVAGNRVTSARYRITGGIEPHVEVELPNGPVAGPVTVLTTGGVATEQLRLEDSSPRLEDSDSSEATAPSQRSESEPGGKRPPGKTGTSGKTTPA
jgi:hypothetical protein